jgi:hypothetical protein
MKTASSVITMMIAVTAIFSLMCCFCHSCIRRVRRWGGTRKRWEENPPRALTAQKLTIIGGKKALTLFHRRGRMSQSSNHTPYPAYLDLSAGDILDLAPLLRRLIRFSREAMRWKELLAEFDPDAIKPARGPSMPPKVYAPAEGCRCRTPPS